MINAPSTEDNTRCEGYQACYDSDINVGSWDSSRFECSGSQSCANGNLDVDKTTCYGKYSCSRSTIFMKEKKTNVDDITFEGYFGGSRSTIYNSKLVNLYGYKALYLGTIDSINMTKALTVNLYGHLSGDSASIICRDNTSCTVNCRTSGCSNLDYICETGAICNIDPVQCDGSRAKYQGIDCPTRTIVVDADIYMEWKYHMNKDIYDAYDEYLDNIMDDDGLDYEDWVDIMGVESQEMILYAKKSIELGQYNQIHNNIVALLLSMIIIGCIGSMWYLSKPHRKDEYIAI